MIVWVVLCKTVDDSDRRFANLCDSNFQSLSELYYVKWGGTQRVDFQFRAILTCVRP